MVDHDIEPLDRRWDHENESIVVITEVHDATAESFMTGKYNWRKEEMSIADFEKNEAYPRDDSVVSAVYLDAVREADVADDAITLDRIRELIEADEIGEYGFPISRLADPATVDDIEASQS